MEKNKKLVWNYFLVFAIAIVFRGLCHIRHCTFIFRTDDFGPLIYPATLAGLDWTEYIEQVHFYYGYGYYWIFAPLFYFMNSFKSVYFTILAINTVLICAIPMLVYKIETKYLKLPNNWITMLLAVSASFFVGDNPMPTGSTWCRTDNEIPIYFLVWILIAAVLATKECKDKKKKIYYSIGVGLVLVWGLTIHERANAIILAIIATVIYVYICKKKWIINPAALIGTVGVGTVIHKIIKKLICAYFWSGDAKNTNAYSEISIYFLKSLAGFRAFCTLIVGNLHSLLIKTYGLPVIAIAVLLFWIYKNGIVFNFIRKRKGKKTEEESENDLVKSNSTGIENDELIMMIFGIAYIIIVIGLAMRWGVGLTNGFKTGEVVKNYKAICYSRYYYPVCGPLVIAVVAYLNTKRVELKKILYGSFGLLVFIEGIFFIFVFGLMSKGANAKYITRAQNIRVISDPVVNFWFGTAVMFILLAVIILISQDKLMNILKEKFKLKIRPIALIAVLMVVYNFAFRMVVLEPDNIYIKFKGEKVVYDFMEQAEDINYDMNGKVYLYETDHQMNFVQLILMDKTIHRGIPEDGEQAVVFTNVKIKELEEKGYIGAKHGNYYVMTNIPEYFQIIEDFKSQK